ncbi:hypothetical protein E2C01_036227 [Portunus trituberculatus]|uniref:Uncharacterized protein n=1 Tax=Portunus trituberculatus TaxID=210409 RepID=A0A5B7FDN7_PORTR|nr:hypothetical protein [Portunus trituberculatus]
MEIWRQDTMSSPRTLYNTTRSVAAGSFHDNTPIFRLFMFIGMGQLMAAGPDVGLFICDYISANNYTNT